MLEHIEQIREKAITLASSDATSTCTDGELVAVLDAAHAAVQALTALLAHTVTEAEQRGIPPAGRRRTTATWLRDRLRIDGYTARRMSGLATLLTEHTALDDALSSSRVNAGQVQVIADSLEVLPSSLGSEVLAKAEAALLDHAEQFEPARLRKLGGRILDQVAPEFADQVEAEMLRRTEQRAWRRRGFTLGAPVGGAVQVTGSLTVEDAAVLQAALDPLTTPGPTDERDPRQRRADALVDVCRLALRSGDLPDSGGQPSRLVVTVGYQTLLDGVGAADTDNGARLSATAARRLACDAGVLPAVLGGAGEPLDVGRSRRLFTGPQRTALAVRDGGCAFPGCDRPPSWCESHHVTSWYDDGRTCLANGVLLCRAHHRVVHEGAWRVEMNSEGHPEFIPPASIDPMRRPLSNIFGRRARSRARHSRQPGTRLAS